MLVICKYANSQDCTDDCEHSHEHEPEEYGVNIFCNSESEYCNEVDDKVICIPVVDYKLQDIKLKAKKIASTILAGIEDI